MGALVANAGLEEWLHSSISLPAPVLTHLLPATPIQPLGSSTGTAPFVLAKEDFGLGQGSDLFQNTAVVEEGLDTAGWERWQRSKAYASTAADASSDLSSKLWKSSMNLMLLWACTYREDDQPPWVLNNNSFRQGLKLPRREKSSL